MEQAAHHSKLGMGAEGGVSKSGAVEEIKFQWMFIP